MLYQVAGLDLGLAVIDMLMSRDRLSIGDIEREHEVSRSSAYRCLRTLEMRGFATLSSTGRGYFAGLRLIAGTNRPVADLNTRLGHRSVLQQIRERTGESVHTAILVGAHVLVVDGRRSRYERGIGLRIEMTAPAHAMAAGKLLLAAYDDRQVSVVIGDEPLRQRATATVRSLEQLRPQLAEIRRQGFAVTIQESEPGINSIAIPLDGLHWRERTALVVSVPIERGSPGRLRELTDITRDTIAEHERDSALRPWRFDTRGRPVARKQLSYRMP